MPSITGHASIFSIAFWTTMKCSVFTESSDTFQGRSCSASILVFALALAAATLIFPPAMAAATLVFAPAMAAAESLRGGMVWLCKVCPTGT